MKTEAGLTTNAAQAAMLDAHGMSIKQICDTVGCGKTSLMRWRRTDAYKKQVEKYREANLEAVEGLVKRYREHLTEAAADAVESLREALEAVDEEGKQDWETRRLAAEMLLQYTGTAVIAPTTAGGKGGDDPDLSGAPNVAIIQLGSGQDHGVEPSVRPAAQEVIEGTAAEVP